MIMQRDIKIGSAVVPMRATAAIPRLYRIKFKRDIMSDMQKLQAAADIAKSENGQFEISDLEVFENVAYIMAKHANANIPSDIDEWLDGFEVFDIYTALPQILALWGDNVATTSTSKKKIGK